jgi:hypothetical protein
MTYEKKCLIELGDILAVQYACTNCGAAVSVPIERLNLDYAATRARSACAYCQTESGFGAGVNETRAFNDFNQALKNAVGIMSGRGLKMFLEIKCPE